MASHCLAPSTAAASSSGLIFDVHPACVKISRTRQKIHRFRINYAPSSKQEIASCYQWVKGTGSAMPLALLPGPQSCYSFRALLARA